uniref:WAP domain-containing protein n=1 Tax=Panagrolaimus superbus TaxID=310955 RepID=A0A914YUZ2_9BILA
MQHSSEEEDDSDQKERRKTSSEEEDVEVVEEVTESAPIEEEEKFKEIDELSKLLEFGKRNGLSTDSPIYAIFAGLFGVTSATLPPTAEWIRKETIPEQTIEITEKPIIQIFTTTQTIPKIPRTTTTIPNRITVTFKPPANSIETSSSEEAGVEGNEEEDYTKRLCDDGSHAIGPCNDDLSCPLDHTCQKGSICCFNFAAAAAKLFLHNNN